MKMIGGNVVVALVAGLIAILCVTRANCKPARGGEEAVPSSGFMTAPGAHVEYQSGLDLLRRFTRQADPANVNSKLCKYKKEPWSACDPQTKLRTRTYTLKRGDRGVCEEQKTVRKECKQKKEGGKKNKNRENKNGNNQQPKNNRERDRPRKKNNHNNN